MSNLSNDVDSLKKTYREIFLQTYKEINSKLEKMTPQDFEKFIEEDAIKEAYKKQLEILERKKSCNCVCCGACCRLACSEFSQEELQKRAASGDKIAKQFSETFIPYESEDEAEKIFPEYFELLKNKAKGEKIYFYHCPKVTADNKCPDYENRPQICRNFPDNPIEFLPKTCAFSKWKEQTEEAALSIHAVLEIIEFYKSKM